MLTLPIDFNKASQQQKQYTDWSNIFNTHESYVIITKPEEVKAISQAILSTLPEPILGVDCEGLTKGRPLSLLQVSNWNDYCFPNILVRKCPLVKLLTFYCRCTLQASATYSTYQLSTLSSMGLKMLWNQESL